MLQALNRDLGLSLAPAWIPLPDGSHVEVDGVDRNNRIYVEAFAHQGPVKGGQIHKVVSDAFKLAFIGRNNEYSRLLLAFADATAAAPFKSNRWFGQAIKQLGIEVVVVPLPSDVRKRLMEAQQRQYR
jgi:hypothetical protein